MSLDMCRAPCALYAGHDGPCVAVYGGAKAAYFSCLDVSTSAQYDQDALLAWLDVLWGRLHQADRDAIEQGA
jgi:hypothetical protein